MSEYNSNYEIAQAISERIGVEPIPFDSVYEICLAIYNELGGEPAEFDSVYEILLGILPLAEGGGSRLIDDHSIATDKTWSSSKINSEISAIAGTANPEIEGKQTEDFTFVQSLPQEGEDDQLVIIKGDNSDTLYKYVSGEWVEQTPDATKLYFDVEGEALYSYVTADHQFARVSMVNTIVVGSNLNSNAELKALKTPGVYSVVQRLTNKTKGDYVKNWTLYVESVDYEEYDRSDSIYQRLVSNYTIQKRTWSATRATNDGWSNFSTYYAGEIKDTTTSKYYTWSSNKLNTELGTKQDALTAGQNISIDANNAISADGYVYDETKHSIATKYLNGEDEQNPYIATNTATGESAVAEGIQTTASNEAAHAEGAYGTVASGKYSHAEGGATTSSGSGSHAEGQQTVASGNYSHAEGNYSIASGKSAHAEGGKLKNQNPTTAAGSASHAEGQSTLASGQSSHAEGELTEAKNGSEHAQGDCNVSHKNSNNAGDAGNTIDSIGIGTVVNNVPQRKNATEVMQNGDMYLIGVGGYQGTDTKVQDATVQTLQDVINGKADAYEVATLADILALFVEPTPVQLDNEIWYTTESGELWEPYDMYGGDTLQIDGNTLLSNTYQDGHGVLRYANDITILDQPWGQTDSDHPSDLRSITFPHLISTIGNILNGNSGLTTAYYNGTVAECSEIGMSNFATYADFDINYQIICTDGTYELWG